ncbi:YvcK family protein [Vagococcus coleopterorum]|uniref:Putative gluconeogenesis factor n=1 Tax=Vagococcus coleopterorum TaxID=2714946 RepID=A0A6G8AP25_9ENTE|nr:YvcK family protein [Vagococcus coleopterorum]QIL46719.1 YvcK family protein [Vagococcus coleopterorum]
MKTYRIEKPKIVIIGGGTGLPVILKALRNESADITAIVTVADDGGSSGSLREMIKVAPPGDLRNVLVSLSDMPKLYEDLFQYRFKKEDEFLADHSVGNLIIAALSEMRGSTYEAIQILSKIMHVEGHVYPVSEEPLTLHAKFKDGTLLSGESKIAKARKPIDHVFVTNSENNELPKASRKVVNAIEEADMVILGPGSLYTSILPNLMIGEIGEAICRTAAEVIYVCNIMTQKGETEHFSDAEHIQVIHNHLGQEFVNTVIVNDQEVPSEYLNASDDADKLDQVTHDQVGLEEEGCSIISTDLIQLRDGGVYHDGEKVVDEIFKLLKVKRS